MGRLSSRLKAWAPLGLGLDWRIRGPSRPESALLDLFRALPHDPLPEFSGREGLSHGGRGRDHPRYGRFIHAFGRHLRPAEVLEVGTYAGGTAVGWARAMLENGAGRLTCVDNDSYSKGIYPAKVTANLARVGFPVDRLRLVNGDSRVELPKLAADLGGRVDAYLIDADHTYEGAMVDLRGGRPLMRPGGWVLVHDVDASRAMPEATARHPNPVMDAVQDFVRDERVTEWYVLEFIRKHLAVLRMPG
jgi:predicted O-methyltransferase YrrM